MIKGAEQPMPAKVKMIEIIQQQPDDATYDDILKELAFQRMVDKGLEDARSGRTISNEEMANRIHSWAR
jgi:predicted transcriptional regulator